MRRALALLVGVQVLTVCAAIASAQQARPSKTVGVVLVVPPTGHLARGGWFGNSCDFFDLKEMNLYGAVFDAAHSVLSARYRVVRVSVAPGAAIRTRNTETFGAFKLFPPIGEQVREFSRAEGPVDLYLVIWSSLSANTCGLHPNTPVGFGIGLTKNLTRPTHLHAFWGSICGRRSHAPDIGFGLSPISFCAPRWLRMEGQAGRVDRSAMAYDQDADTQAAVGGRAVSE